MRYLVEFKRLGRDRKTVVAEIDSLGYRDLWEIVSPHIASRHPDFALIVESRTGVVWAGWNRVGEFSWREIA